jgi:hypothetical protein
VLMISLTLYPTRLILGHVDFNRRMVVATNDFS